MENCCAAVDAENERREQEADLRQTPPPDRNQLSGLAFLNNVDMDEDPRHSSTRERPRQSSARKKTRAGRVSRHPTKFTPP